MDRNEQDLVLQKYFADFVQLRKSGYSPEEAWRITQESASDIDMSMRKQLAALVQAWESRVGHQYGNGDGNLYRTSTLGRVNQLPDVPGQSSLSLPDDEEDRSKFFGRDTILLIYLPVTREPLRVKIPLRDEVIIGRAAPDSILIPDIDLAELGEQFGVSRVHASLKRRDDTLMLTDLGSRNHTFINNERLQANEVRVLRSNDELRFASLTTKIRFFTAP